MYLESHKERREITGQEKKPDKTMAIFSQMWWKKLIYNSICSRNTEQAKHKKTLLWKIIIKWLKPEYKEQNLKTAREKWH